MARAPSDPYLYLDNYPRRRGQTEFGQNKSGLGQNKSGAGPNTSGPGQKDAPAPRSSSGDYAHYLIPRDNTFRATGAQITALASAWLEGGYIAQPASDSLQRLDFSKTAWSKVAAATGAVMMTQQTAFAACPVPPDAPTFQRLKGRDFRLAWPLHTVWSAGLKYPLDRMPKTPRGEQGPSLTLEVHSLNDYVYLMSDLLQPFPSDTPATAPVNCTVSGTNLHFTADRPDNIYDLMGSRIKHTCPTCQTPFRPQERSVTIRDGWTGQKREQPGGAAYRFAIVIDCGASVPELGPPKAVPEFLSLCEVAIGQPLYQVGNTY
jgi:hypothetical protein